MTRDALVVWGMHRSGTSALARVLGLAGAALPEDLMRPQADNPTGFWESVGVARANERMLASFGRSWSDARPLPCAFDARRRSAAVATARRLLASRWPAEGPIVIKDPRLSRLATIWLPALEAAGFSPRLILPLRHPDEVASSLEARDGFSPARSRRLWLAYTLDAWGCERAPRAIVRYADLLANWRTVLERLRECLGIALPLSESAAHQIDAFLSADLRHYVRETSPDDRPDEDLADRVYRTLDRAAEGETAELRREFEGHQAAWRLLAPGLERDMSEAQPLSTAPSTGTPAKPGGDVGPGGASGAGPSPTAPPRTRPRPLVVHYHLFKNAGTSLDRTLRANFGATWDAFEGPRRELPMPQLREYLAARPWIAALSSHKALLPAPVLTGVEVIPVIFVRHPLDRIRSIYGFERKQRAETDGALAAKRLDLPGYVSWRLDRPGDRALANFQAYRLAYGGTGPDEAARALDAVRTLPFVGLVEAYDASLQRLQALLAPYFPRINLAVFHVNVTDSERAPMDERLAELKASLGEELYERAERANELDLALWERVREMFGVRQG